MLPCPEPKLLGVTIDLEAGLQIVDKAIPKFGFPQQL